MTETTVLKQINVSRDIASSERIMSTAQKHRLSVMPATHIPAYEQESFSLPEAARVFGVDYEALRGWVNMGLIDTFRPLSRRGTPGRRRIRRVVMQKFLAQFDE
ncbi:hypothetical protein EJ419_07225 [Alloscardovia theropitheci]|uniref:Uncharacterized protein n=1 Tax=Alloscardovia theropitheci TaxID=2496842 RepID=A0A4R0QW84_9BIFI|nr:hypothetical protein [Alloscardovia theropitheci]TCD53750.1 hypothetical protein EJ419_07225 [Alloscardovia theropitheci]